MNDARVSTLAWTAPPPWPAEADDVYVAAARAGDLTAFEELFRRHRQTMQRVAARFLDSPDEVEDAVTDAFVRAFRALPGFRGDSQFATWLYRITVNVCLKRRRRALRGQPETSLEDAGDLPAGPGVDTVLEQRARRQLIRHRVNQLTPKLRSVVVLYYFEDMTCEQVAQVLELSVGTVWSRLNAAKLRLAGALREELFA